MNQLRKILNNLTQRWKQKDAADKLAFSFFSGLAGLIGFVFYVLISTYNAKWILTIIDQVNGNPKVMSVVTVEHVQHEPDGAICFRTVQTDINGCIKTNYILTQAKE